MSNGKMLILRGNSGSYEDEDGKKHDYNMGALHEKAAKDYAASKDYVGEVLPVAGNWPKQTDDAVQLLKAKDSPYAAIYGFSGGSSTCGIFSKNCRRRRSHASNWSSC